MTDRTVRVYLPLTLEGLAALEQQGATDPGPLRAHAVTAALREAWPDGDEEELEYAALTAAAQGSLGLSSDQPLRVVVALDVKTVEELQDDEDPTAVAVAHQVPRRRVAAVHVDTEGAASAVGAARAAAGTSAYDWLAEQCLDHELAWYATQEIGDLLDR